MIEIIYITAVFRGSPRDDEKSSVGAPRPSRLVHEGDRYVRSCMHDDAPPAFLRLPSEVDVRQGVGDGEASPLLPLPRVSTA